MMFLAEDGKVFKTEKECREYEQQNKVSIALKYVHMKKIILANGGEIISMVLSKDPDNAFHVYIATRLFGSQYSIQNDGTIKVEWRLEPVIAEEDTKFREILKQGYSKYNFSFRKMYKGDNFVMLNALPDFQPTEEQPSNPFESLADFYSSCFNNFCRW